MFFILLPKDVKGERICTYIDRQNRSPAALVWRFVRAVVLVATKVWINTALAPHDLEQTMTFGDAIQICGSNRASAPDPVVIA